MSTKVPPDLTSVQINIHIYIYIYISIYIYIYIYIYIEIRQNLTFYNASTIIKSLPILASKISSLRITFGRPGIITYMLDVFYLFINN